MVLELEEAEKWKVFQSDKLETYSFIYLISKTVEQKKPRVLDASQLILNLDASQEVKDVLARRVTGLPDGFKEADFDRCPLARVQKIFSSLKTNPTRRADEMYTSLELSLFAADLLDIKSADKLADFYGSPDSFLRNVLQDKARDYRFEQRPALFVKDEFERDFNILQNDILFEPKKRVEFCADDFSKSLGRTFDKIYAFIPIFQNSNWEARRLAQNTIRSQDQTYEYVHAVIERLAPGGRAAVCVSDILFSPKMKALRKFICGSGVFEGLIRLPAGEIHPKYLSSSLLIFDSSRARDSFTFLDLRQMKRPDGQAASRSILTNTNAAFAAQMFRDNGIGSRDGAERQALSRAELEEKDFDFETKKPFDPIKFIMAYPWRLGEFVEISRGLQDTENIRAFSSGDPNAPYAYLNVSDIQDGRIVDDGMARLSDKKEGWDKYFLKAGDIVLSKLPCPALKAAIYEGPDNKVLPASNLFRIRVKKNGMLTLNPYYLKLYFESEPGQKYLMSATSGSRMPAISKESLMEMKIPSKTDKEQKEIEKKYKALQKERDDLLAKLRGVSEKMKKILEF